MKVRSHSWRTTVLVLLVTALATTACGYTAPRKKDKYDVELEINLSSASGQPLANYRFLADHGYTDKLPKTTDEHGRYNEVLTRHNTPTTTFLGSGLLPPRELSSFNLKLEFYLPKINPYGLYPAQIGEHEETRRLTMIPYGQKLEATGLDPETASKGPPLQIATRVTRLKTRRGWHLKIDLVLLDS